MKETLEINDKLVTSDDKMAKTLLLVNFAK